MILSMSNPVRAAEVVLYQNVASPEKWDQRYLTRIEFDRVESVPEFIVSDKHLSLRIQSTRTKFGLWTEVDQPEWTQVSLQKFTKLHPELRRLLPNPTLSNGGIAWIPPK
jgi:hypothetical protein